MLETQTDSTDIADGSEPRSTADYIAIHLPKLFSLVVAQPLWHAKLLNTFSFLEYIGFRKIAKSQAAEKLSLETLSHASEEARHAVTLKRLSLRMGGSRFDLYNEETLICGEAAEEYFQNLDQFCAITAKNSQRESSEFCYRWVTYLIEIRALAVYQEYLKHCADPLAQSILAGLIKEENNHLAQVGIRIKADGDHPICGEEIKNFEQLQFKDLLEKWITQIKSDIKT